MKAFVGCFIACWLLLGLAGCGGEEPAEPVEMVVDASVDFIYRFDEKRFQASNEEYVYHAPLMINDRYEWMFFEHAPCTLRFPEVYIGPDASLQFAIAMLPKSWVKEGDGVRFEIDIEIPGQGTQNVYSRYINPKANQDERRFIDEKVALTEIQDVTATVIFRTFRGETAADQNNDSDWAVWGHPRLVSNGRVAERLPENEPNVMVITIDTTRADYLRAYGNDWVQTPTLDRLVEGGVLFENAYSVSCYTNPSHLSILTGVSPLVHEIPDNASHLPAAVPALPVIMQSLDYHAGASVSVYHLAVILETIEKSLDLYDKPSDRYPVRPDFMTAQAAIQGLESVRDGKPFLYWVHFFFPHAPYLAISPEHKMYYEGDPTAPSHNSMEGVYHPNWTPGITDDWLTEITDFEYTLREYGAEITSTDRMLGRLIEALERQNRLENTILVITADHGESFGEHGIYFDHWTTHYQDIHVPLLIYYPKSLPQNERYSELVSTMDIAPTVLDLLDMQGSMMGQFMEGVSLRPLWQGESLPPRIHYSDASFGNSTAAWDEQYKVIWQLRNSAFAETHYNFHDRVMVYDRQADLKEQDPIAIFTWQPAGSLTPVEAPDPLPLPLAFEGEQYYEIKRQKQNYQPPSVDALKNWFDEYEESTPDQPSLERIRALMVHMAERMNESSIFAKIRDVPELDRFLDQYESEAGELDPEMIEHLKSLGYL